MTTVDASVASTDSIEGTNDAVTGGSSGRLLKPKLNTTSSLVNGSPSCQVTSRRSFHVVFSLPSGRTFTVPVSKEGIAVISRGAGLPSESSLIRPWAWLSTSGAWPPPVLLNCQGPNVGVGASCATTIVWFLGGAEASAGLLLV